MRQVYLLGDPDSKRTIYMRYAAEAEGTPLLFADWKEWEGSGKWSGQICGGETELFIKIDPPRWESCRLGELEKLTGEYCGQLEKMALAARSGYVTFLNTPGAIAALLDKRSCKAALVSAGLPVTETLRVPARMKRAMPFGQAGEECGPEESWTAGRLLEAMDAAGCRQVFIKPVRGSGAAGVSALRRQQAGGRMALYTCAQLHPQYGIVNTKCLRRLEEEKEIVSLLDKILELDCIVERWYAKAAFRDHCYDLRAVMQDGRLDYLLARLSRGPITNLHLNNHPLEIGALGLPGAVLEETTDLCKKAMACFPGLRSAGIDILLEKGSLRPRIIEMNAQGDLIYQDIYGENRIYRRQAAMMRQWLEGVHDERKNGKNCGAGSTVTPDRRIRGGQEDFRGYESDRGAYGYPLCLSGHTAV